MALTFIKRAESLDPAAQVTGSVNLSQ